MDFFFNDKNRAILSQILMELTRRYGMDPTVVPEGFLHDCMLVSCRTVNVIGKETSQALYELNEGAVSQMDKILREFIMTNRQQQAIIEPSPQEQPPTPPPMTTTTCLFEGQPDSVLDSWTITLQGALSLKTLCYLQWTRPFGFLPENEVTIQVDHGVLQTVRGPFPTLESVVGGLQKALDLTSIDIKLEGDTITLTNRRTSSRFHPDTTIQWGPVLGELFNEHETRFQGSSTLRPSRFGAVDIPLMRVFCYPDQNEASGRLIIGHRIDNRTYYFPFASGLEIHALSSLHFKVSDMKGDMHFLNETLIATVVASK